MWDERKMGISVEYGEYLCGIIPHDPMRGDGVYML